MATNIISMLCLQWSEDALVGMSQITWIKFLAFFFLFLSVPSNVKLLENINQGAGFRVETPIQYSFLGSEKAERWQENGIKRVLDSVEKRTNKSLIRNGASFARICFLLTLFKMKGEGNEGGGGGWGGWGRKAKRPLAFFPLWLLQTLELASETFWLLVVTLFPQWRKMSRPYLVPVPDYCTWTKSTLKKIVFFGQILMKLRLW